MRQIVVLGVTGSVAAYRAADVVRELMRNYVEVRVCLTRAAQEFVTPQLFEALTGQPCLTNAFDEPERGRMSHIDFARAASVILVCPATANAIATVAHGQGQDMFTSIILAASAQLIFAPAMNPQMYAAAATIDNIRILKERGAVFVDPDEGDVACGENGQGKLAKNERIVEATLALLKRSALLKNKKVVITAGPTHEPLDPVRYIANRSSGKMGIALARAASQMGADVSLILGPTSEIPPPFADVKRVETAEEMLGAAMSAATGADLFIGAAAVADFRADTSSTKTPSGETRQITLHPNPDIITEVGRVHPRLKRVGFAAETSADLSRAQKKLEQKGLAAIVLNDVSRNDIGFGSLKNEGTLIFEDGTQKPLPKASKLNFALQVLEEIADRLL